MISSLRVVGWSRGRSFGALNLEHAVPEPRPDLVSVTAGGKQERVVQALGRKSKAVLLSLDLAGIVARRT